MRILLINTYHYARGGAEVHVLALASALKDAGHEVRFFGMDDPRNEPSPDSAHWVPHIDFAEMNKVKSPKTGIRVLRRSIYSFDAARRIRAMVDEWRPDIAHLHGIHAHLTLSVPVELHRRAIPVVWTLHDYRLICPNTNLHVRGEICERCKGGRFTQCVLNRCKKDSVAASAVAALESELGKFIRVPRRVRAFVAPSRFLLAKFEEFGWDTSSFVHIPNFSPAAVTRVDRRPVPGRFLYTGRIDGTKGVSTLLGAIAGLQGVTLDVAGDGPIADAMRSLAERIAPGKVTFHGHVGPDRLATLRDAACAVVVPSECYENSPYAVTEAFSRGCPVVATNIGGMPELVSSEENGLLFARGDTEDLARVLRRLADDTDLQGRLSTGALGTAGKLGIDNYLPRLLEVYRLALGV